MPPRSEVLRKLGDEAVRALGFGLLSLTMGSIQFGIPGLTGGSTDLREIPILVAAFYFKRWWPLLIVVAITSLATPAEGSILSTFICHALAAPLAWLAARGLQRRVANMGVLGACWALFVVVGYYGLALVPLILVTGAAAGLVSWSQIPLMYGAMFSRSLFFEVVSTAATTSLFLVNLHQVRLRAEARESLRASEARLAGMLAAAPVGIALLRAGRIAWANLRLAQLSGWSQEELVDRLPEELLEPRGGSSQGLEGLLAGAAAAGTSSGVEFSLRTAGGAHLATLVHAATMPGEPEPTYTLSILDIQERVLLEQQFRKAQKLEALGQVVGTVAHDFGNLLQVVSLSAERITSALEQGRSPASSLDQIQTALAQSRRVIQQLLTFSRRQPMEPTAVDLDMLLQGTAPMLQTVAGREITLLAAMSPGLPPILADPGQVEQVLLNLVINARDAILAGGGSIRTISLRTGRLQAEDPQHPDMVVLTVEDTGVGMDEATQNRIFEPFFTTKAEGQGSGLGLATVYGIVQRHGGSIAVSSEPGRGTNFRLTWPIDRRPESTGGTGPV